MARLGITEPLRPGPAGSGVNAPNFDESKAKAKSPVPPLLAMADGRAITTPAMWQQRRGALFEIFYREIYGRLPEVAKTIKVTWEVTGTTQGRVTPTHRTGPPSLSLPATTSTRRGVNSYGLRRCRTNGSGNTPGIPRRFKLNHTPASC
ncbi:MAG: hypothetical protein WCL04_05190 [Verrucomicrobiota bacterium]